jgi:glucose uptake protein GlcU
MNIVVMQNIIYLIIHILFALGLFISLKLINVKNLNKFQAISVNYSVAVAFTLADLALNNSGWEYSSKLFLPSFTVGLLFIVSFLVIIYSTQKVGIGLTTSFNKMSVVIPVTVGVIYLGQNSDIFFKIGGIVLALISFFLILYKKPSERVKGTFILPFLVFLLPGINDTSMELTKTYIISDPADREMFLLGVFLTALFFSLILVYADFKRDSQKVVFRYNTILLGAALGLFNFLTSKMLLINVGRMGGSVVFPVHNASVVMLTALIGVFFFKESFSKRQWMGVLLAVVAVFMIASTL